MKFNDLKIYSMPYGKDTYLKILKNKNFKFIIKRKFKDKYV